MAIARSKFYHLRCVKSHSTTGVHDCSVLGNVHNVEVPAWDPAYHPAHHTRVSQPVLPHPGFEKSTASEKSMDGLTRLVKSHTNNMEISYGDWRSHLYMGIYGIYVLGPCSPQNLPFECACLFYSFQGAEMSKVVPITKSMPLFQHYVQHYLWIFSPSWRCPIHGGPKNNPVIRPWLSNLSHKLWIYGDFMKITSETYDQAWFITFPMTKNHFQVPVTFWFITFPTMGSNHPQEGPRSTGNSHPPGLCCGHVLTLRAGS